MQKDTASKFSATTVILHWIVAILMIGLLASGLYMTSWEDYGIYSWHKSFGMTLFAFAVLRVVWRLYNGWPEPIGGHAVWERVLARVTHYVLIIAILAMPISGMLMTAMSGRPLVLFGWTLVGPNQDVNGERLPRDGDLAGLGHEIHEWLGLIIIGVIVLHALGALKHHMIDKDGTLKRMLGARIY